jgi:hypothetical protein
MTMNALTAATPADPTAQATLLLAVITALLVAFTAVIAVIGIWQAFLTRRALEAATQDTRELARARVDQRGPLVTLTAEAAAASTRAWLVHMNPTDQYLLPRDVDLSMALMGYFRATNEGRSTAIVDVPEGVLILPADQPITGLNSFAGSSQPSAHTQFALRPGESKMLLVETRHTLGEWVAISETDEATAPAIKFMVDDTFAQGVRDRTDLFLCGRPVMRDSEADIWRLDPTSTALVVGRTVRTYWAERQPG